MRNESLFRALLGFADRTMQHHKIAGDYDRSVADEAHRLNATFVPPMDPKEVGVIVRSVLGYRPHRHRDRALELKRHREAQGRTRVQHQAQIESRIVEGHKLYARHPAREIADALGVSVRTVVRYLAQSITITPSTIPIQGNADAVPAQPTTTAPETVQKDRKMKYEAPYGGYVTVDGLPSPWSRLYMRADDLGQGWHKRLRDAIETPNVRVLDRFVKEGASEDRAFLVEHEPEVLAIIEYLRGIGPEPLSRVA